jgi:hypothetical protein
MDLREGEFDWLRSFRLANPLTAYALDADVPFPTSQEIVAYFRRTYRVSRDMPDLVLGVIIIGGSSGLLDYNRLFSQERPRARRGPPVRRGPAQRRAAGSRLAWRG